MGDLEEAEAGKGCREEKIHMDKIDFANESLRLQKVDEFSEILRRGRGVHFRSCYARSKYMSL